MSPIHLGYLKRLDRLSAAEQTVRVGFVSDKKGREKKDISLWWRKVIEICLKAA